MNSSQRLALLLTVVALFGGCKDDEVITPTRYLERPNAVDFFCVGYVTEDSDTLTGLPAEACNPDDETTGPTRWLFGLVVNSARSEVAMVDITDGALVDLANQNPGYGFVPVGENPIGVRVTEDGCAAYVTNHGSCDISVLNINRTLHAAGYDVAADSAPGAATGRIALRTPTGRLLARPSGLVLRPEYVSTAPPVRQCGTLEGHRAYVSLPACGLVAEVDLDSGRILQSLRLTGGVAQSAGIDPRCPAECRNWQDEDVAVGGDLAEDRPGPLLVTRDGLRLVIGSVTRPEITIVDLDIVNGQFLNPRTIQLADEERGVLRIRQSPFTVNHNWYFFYVVTRSGVIHVLDADFEQECETNPDPTDPFFPEGQNVVPADWEAWEPAKGCLALSDPDTPERAPGVDTPAIRLPGERMAVDVAFAELAHEGYETVPESKLASYYLGGTYAYAVAMDGVAYLINVDEIYPTEPEDPDLYLNHRRGDGVHAILSHQLRTALNTDGGEDYNGRPRVDSEDPQELYVDGERVLEEEFSQHDHVAPAAVPTVDILDPYRTISQTWSLTYMGVLPRADRFAGQLVRDDLDSLGPDQAEFRDVGVGFCWAGVKDGDVLELAGCADDDDCNLGFFCHRSNLQSLGTDGICLRQDAKSTLQDRCERLAVTPRRWEILRAEDDRLILGVLALDVADATACEAEGLDNFCCTPGVGAADSDAIVGVLTDDGCVASPLPDLSYTADIGNGATRLASCFEGLLRYTIRVGPEQYLLVGSYSGVELEGVPDGADGGHCIQDPAVDPVIGSRVPRVEGTPFRNANMSFSLALGSAVHPEPDYNILFEITAGFSPRVVDVSARLPAVVEEAPDGYLYVIDQGDENIAGGLQGQVLRLLPGDIALDTGFVVR